MYQSDSNCPAIREPYIFLCNTPYHVAFAWSIAKTQGVLSDSVFVLYKASVIGDVIARVVGKDATVLRAENALELFQLVPELKRHPGRLAVGNDYNLINQIFIRLMYREHDVFEDGMVAYLSQPYQSAGLTKLLKTVLNFLFPGIVFNVRGNNASEAVQYYALRKNAFSFLGNVSPNVISLDKDLGLVLIHEYGIDSEILNSSHAIFISQPISETRGWGDFEKEKAIYAAHADILRGKDIILKSHPREGRDFFEKRLSYLKGLCCRVAVFPGSIPLELMSVVLRRNAIILGVDSSALLNLRLDFGFDNVYFFPDIVDNPAQTRLRESGIREVGFLGRM